MDGEMISPRPVVCASLRIIYRGDRKLLRIICRVRRAAKTEKTNCYNSGDPDSVYQSTVPCVLLRLDIHSWRPNHFAALTKYHHQQQIQ